jgi:hypothetical protein
MVDQRRRALLHHELTHIEAWDRTRDDIGRPALQTRHGDWNFDGFHRIVELYGEQSVEYRNLAMIAEMHRQLNLPFGAAAHTDVPGNGIPARSVVGEALTELAEQCGGTVETRADGSVKVTVDADRLGIVRGDEDDDEDEVDPNDFDEDNVHWLANTPAGDVNFKAALRRSDRATLTEALTRKLTAGARKAIVGQIKKLDKGTNGKKPHVSKADELAAAGPVHFTCNSCNLARPLGVHPCPDCLDPEYTLTPGECPVSDPARA